MKFFLFSLLSFVTISCSFAQDKDLNVVATAGSTFVVNDISLDWTLGEVIVEYLEQPGIIVTQGFHQPLYSLVAVHAIPEDLGMILVLPNPFSDELDIKMSYKNFVSGTVRLCTIDGAEMWSKKFEGNVIHEIYDSSLLPSGSYVLSVSLATDAFVQSYTIVKTQ